MSNKPTKNNAKQKQSFFAYYRAEAQRLRSGRLVRVCGGFIIDDATDVGPGLFVDMPGYARWHRALDLGTVDAFAEVRRQGWLQ
jgi:hypothetical protein